MKKNNNIFLKERKEIEKMDSKIFELLQKRFLIVEKIGKIKKENNIKIIDRKREEKIIEKAINSSNLSPEFIKKVYRLIFKESYKNQ